MGFQSLKAIEHARALGFWDAGAVIGHLQTHCGFLCVFLHIQRYIDTAVRRCIFQCVIQQIDHQLKELIAIATHMHIVQCSLHLNLTLSPNRGVQFHCIFNQVTQCQ